MKSTVIVSRKWKETEIKTTVVLLNDGIEIKMSLPDFIHALSRELLTGWFAKKLHEKSIKAAAEKVINEMKNESAKGV